MHQQVGIGAAGFLGIVQKNLRQLEGISGENHTPCQEFGKHRNAADIAEMCDALLHAYQRLEISQHGA